MGRRGKFVSNRNKKRRVHSTEKGSDDSDEDYVLEEEEEEDSDLSDELCASSAGELFDSDVISSGEKDKKKIGSKAFRSNCQNGFFDRKKSRLKRSRRRIRFLDGEDYDDGGDYDDDDEDFTLDGIDVVDEEEELQVKKKSNVVKVWSRRKASVKGQKRKRKSKVSKDPSKNKRRRRLVMKRRASSDDDFAVENAVKQEKKSRKKPGRRRKLVVHSDSDLVCSGSSDYEYTISEDEREQLREASSICGDLITCPRSSLLSRRLQVDGASNHHQQRKPATRTRKEKFDGVQEYVGKPVCGICLSEEGQGTIRGTLNCCSHYFCFACIMEWSKVESRCPLCKQRFVTIGKAARLNLGIDLRNVVIQVPKRDQVYQPSEEEVRGYLDPYENVVCIECQQGGHDNLMLLCDICDSPAHTYCVGLGQEVPEGNWYCNGCRPEDPGSSKSQVENPLSEMGTRRINLPTELSAEANTATVFVPASQNSASTPEPSSGQGTVFHPSPRFPAMEGFQATSPLSGAGPSTLLGRRRLHHQIFNLISNSRARQLIRRSGHHNSESGFVNSEVRQRGETSGQPTTSGNDQFHSSVVENNLQNSTPPILRAGFSSLRRF